MSEETTIKEKKKTLRERIGSMSRVDWLVMSAIMTGAPRWAGAMLIADVGEVTGWVAKLLSIGNTISGLAIGPLEVLSVSFVFDGIRKSEPFNVVQKKRYRTVSAGRGKTKREQYFETIRTVNLQWWLSMLFGVGLLALTPLVIGPYIMTGIAGEGIAEVLDVQGQWAWAIFTSIAPVFMIGGVMFAQNLASGATETTANDGKRQEDEKQHKSLYRDLADAEKHFIASSPTHEIVSRMEIAESTARNWRTKAQKEGYGNSVPLPSRDQSAKSEIETGKRSGGGR